MKPPITYFGGKTSIAPKIAALLPPHEHYVEPFAGSLAVLLAKPPSCIETVNDLDGDLICTLNDPGRGRWLTVRGSAHGRPVLHSSREAAIADQRPGQCVAHVTEVTYPGVAGGAFEITEGTLTSRDGSLAVDFDGRPVYA